MIKEFSNVVSRMHGRYAFIKTCNSRLLFGKYMHKLLYYDDEPIMIIAMSTSIEDLEVFCDLYLIILDRV